MTETELRDIEGLAASARLVRVLLSAVVVVLLVSALALIFAPSWVEQAIGLDGDSSTRWTLQVLGATLIGFAGMMWLTRRAGDNPVMGSAIVLMLASGLVFLLMLTLPGDWAPLRIVALVLALACAVSCLLLLLSGRRP
ncbi:MAG: hypothetical protein ACR2KE_06200 [Candidatus Nanopelagicales bacterium]